MRPFVQACVLIVSAMGLIGTTLSILVLRPERGGPIPRALLVGWKREPKMQRVVAFIGYAMMAALVAVAIAIAG